MHKFASDDTESRDLLRRLRNLEDRELVFADPSDAILGIGYSIAEAEEMGREQWGANIFGKSLDAVRTITKATVNPDRDVAAVSQGLFNTSIFDLGGRLSVNW